MKVARNELQHTSLLLISETNFHNEAKKSRDQARAELTFFFEKIKTSEQVEEAGKKERESLNKLLRETETRLDNKNSENLKALRKLREIEKIQEQTAADLKVRKGKNERKLSNSGTGNPFYVLI